MPVTGRFTESAREANLDAIGPEFLVDLLCGIARFQILCDPSARCALARSKIGGERLDFPESGATRISGSPFEANRWERCRPMPLVQPVSRTVSYRAMDNGHFSKRLGDAPYASGTMAGGISAAVMGAASCSRVSGGMPGLMTTLIQPSSFLRNFS
jgi:hypothetical protein